MGGRGRVCQRGASQEKFGGDVGTSALMILLTEKLERISGAVSNSTSAMWGPDSFFFSINREFIKFAIRKEIRNICLHLFYFFLG